MEKNRSSKVIAIVALLVAVGGLSLGFAAFSNTLRISSNANVKPSSNTFNVDFSSSDTGVVTDPVTPVKDPTTITAKDATIDNTTDPTITDLSATFTEPGQKATYTFYAANVGEYDAFLKAITYENVQGETATKICTAGENTTDALVQSACDAITVKVKVGTEAETAGSVASITKHSLVKDTNEPIVVTIEYAADGARADGDFSVKFGDITLTYSSVD